MVQKVEETADAHRLLMAAFEQARPQIPDGQLVEVAFDDLVKFPLVTVERIYRQLGIDSWRQARAAIQARSERARKYRARPVVLEQAAERRLQELMKPAATTPVD